MEIPIYHVDAFTDRVFAGNPAAVCLLAAWLPPEVLQAIAAENNLSETAFLVPRQDGYEIRWFSPAVEIDLCGHATLASGHVAFNHLNPSRGEVRFLSPRSGPLTVSRQGDLLRMDFPSRPPVPCTAPPSLAAGLGRAPREVLRADDYLAVFATEAEVRSLTPDFATLRQLDARGVIISAPGEEADFVSRFFAPKVGIDEDPVTGSAHCTLAPFWRERLGKNPLTARQVSRRGGELFCEDAGERVIIAGRAVGYLRGTITI